VSLPPSPPVLLKQFGRFGDETATENLLLKIKEYNANILSLNKTIKYVLKIMYDEGEVDMEMERLIESRQIIDLTFTGIVMTPNVKQTVRRLKSTVEKMVAMMNTLKAYKDNAELDEDVKMKISDALNNIDGQYFSENYKKFLDVENLIIPGVIKSGE
jgi:predicted transcriptional regulator